MHCSPSRSVRSAGGRAARGEAEAEGEGVGVGVEGPPRAPAPQVGASRRVWAFNSIQRCGAQQSAVAMFARAQLNRSQVQTHVMKRPQERAISTGSPLPTLGDRSISRQSISEVRVKRKSRRRLPYRGALGVYWRASRDEAGAHVNSEQ